MQVHSIDSQNSNSFSGLLTIRKKTNMLENLYRIRAFRNQRLTNVTLNTDFVESVNSLIDKKAVPALQDNIIINMINGVRYKIAGCSKDSFMEVYNKAHIKNSEEIFTL